MKSWMDKLQLNSDEKLDGVQEIHKCVFLNASRSYLYFLAHLTGDSTTRPNL